MLQPGDLGAKGLARLIKVAVFVFGSKFQLVSQ